MSSETRTKGGNLMALEQFDYSKLRGKIKEKCGTQNKFAKRIGMGKVSLSQRLNNYLDWSRSEMKNACEVLELSIDEIPLYFFTPKVQKHELQEECA
jgi:hypothetical protein